MLHKVCLLFRWYAFLLSATVSCCRSAWIYLFCKLLHACILKVNLFSYKYMWYVHLPVNKSWYQLWTFIYDLLLSNISLSRMNLPWNDELRQRTTKTKSFFQILFQVVCFFLASTCFNFENKWELIQKVLWTVWYQRFFSRAVRTRGLI
jgi:hypothetical protein